MSTTGPRLRSDVWCAFPGGDLDRLSKKQHTCRRERNQTRYENADDAGGRVRVRGVRAFAPEDGVHAAALPAHAPGARAVHATGVRHRADSRFTPTCAPCTRTRATQPRHIRLGAARHARPATAQPPSAARRHMARVHRHGFTRRTPSCPARASRMPSTRTRTLAVAPRCQASARRTAGAAARAGPEHARWLACACS